LGAVLVDHSARPRRAARHEAVKFIDELERANGTNRAA